jgi:hypothetical protein
VFDDLHGCFIPAPDVGAWIRTSFLDPESPLYNVEHDHLNSADIGVLWTNVGNSRHMNAIAGTAEMPTPQGGKWQKGRALYQLRRWFGAEPDFLITLSAEYAAEVSDVVFCALVEHELYHCAQRLDAFGIPMFTQEGRPKFGIRGHDVEEFVGIVRRYGAKAGAGDTEALVKAARRKPEIAAADIKALCGTCAG